jgi:2-oxoglutarate dehydrogenase E2 component (dihydrolipoamide succinyltransferase)
MAAEMGITPASGTGKDGRVTKADLVQPVVTTPAAPLPTDNRQPTTAATERVPMTRIRKTIATRLKQAQNTAAMLTTYNEVDMFAVNNLRKLYKDAFEKKHGVKLGFMGFFTKAVCAALEEFPALNAEIDGDDIVYKNYHDIGIAVSSAKGLVVPVVRGAAGKSLAQVERDIGDFGNRAKNGGLKPDELVGATFSITNGGTFGSLMSMPILNYPQVGILGMHAIKDRPVVVDGQIVIRPMMYLALTYDHRIVDGKEAVSFLVTVKNMLEDPARFLLGV